MQPRIKPGPNLPRPAFTARLVRLALLALPVAVFVLAGLRYGRDYTNLIWLGALFQALAALLLLFGGRGWNLPLGLPAAMINVIGLSWLVLALPGAGDGFLYIARFTLIILPLGFFASVCLTESGAQQLRRANQLADRLARKTRWPKELEACRLVPEVAELREALRLDAGPALALLGHQLPQLRVAALAALQGRRQWLPGQAEVILHLVHHAEQPEVRLGAIGALSEIEDRIIVEALADFLRDPDRRVRDAAADSVLANTERRWGWIREAVRNALAHPNGYDDGPLCPIGHQFTDEAVEDLTAWACEKGILALRATMTLGAHADQVLAQGQNPELVQSLRKQLTDVHAPPVLRLELARASQRYHELDSKVLQALIDPSTPAPLRLIAVETLLTRGDSPEARAALYDLARLPNREIALATAEVLQHRLGVDVGLPRGQPLPPIHSRLAADVARKVQLWSSRPQVEGDDENDEPAW